MCYDVYGSVTVNYCHLLSSQPNDYIYERHVWHVTCDYTCRISEIINTPPPHLLLCYASCSVLILGAGSTSTKGPSSPSTDLPQDHQSGGMSGLTSRRLKSFGIDQLCIQVDCCVAKQQLLCWTTTLRAVGFVQYTVLVFSQASEKQLALRCVRCVCVCVPEVKGAAICWYYYQYTWNQLLRVHVRVWFILTMNNIFDRCGMSSFGSVKFSFRCGIFRDHVCWIFPEPHPIPIKVQATTSYYA